MVLKNYIKKYGDGGGANDISRRREAVQFFIDKGYSKEIAFGIVGNLMVESYSDLQTNALGDDGSAYGIAQWRGSRQTNLKKVRAKDWDTFRGQLEFVDYELNNSEYEAKKHLLKSKTAREAALSFSSKFERPNSNWKVNHNQTRIDNTEVLRREYGDDSGIIASTKEESALNNDPDIIVQETIDNKLPESSIANMKNSNVGVSPVNMDTTDFLRFDKESVEEIKQKEALGLSQGEIDIYKEALDNLKVRASSAKTPEIVQREIEQYRSLIGDPYNYINIETFQRGGEKRRDNTNIVQRRVIEDIRYQPDLIEKNATREYLQNFNVRDKISYEGTMFAADLPLYKPDNKEGVERTQSFLIDKGYNLGKSGVDGVYGAGTDKALTDYNSKLNPLDNRRVRDDLTNDDIIMGNVLKEWGNYDVENLPELKSPEYYKGADKGAIKELQERLVADGSLSIKKDAPNNPTKTLELQKFLVDEGYDLGKYGENGDGIDGDFGAMTKKALTAYNKDLSKIDGDFGAKTKEALNKSLGKEDMESTIPNVEEEVEEEIASRTKVLNIKEASEKDPLGIGSVRDTRDKSFIDKEINGIPVFVRQYMYDTVRGSGDVTENDLNDGEYSALVRSVKNALKGDKKNKLTYDDFRAVGAPGKDVRTSGVEFSNPTQSVQLLLGQASINIDDEGHVYVTDEYDYNDAGDKKNRYKNSLTNDEGLLDIGESTSFSNGIYRVARNFKTLFARPPGNGSKVKIHLGNISEYASSE